MHPVLTLLVAGSLQIADDLPRPLEGLRISLPVTQTLGGGFSTAAPEEEALTVRDIPFYYRRVSIVAVPPVFPQVSYDWRSPVFFDVP